MRRTLFIVATASALLLTGCGKPASIESVDSLVQNPDRLKALRAQCKADHAKVGNAQCNAVAEATRQRFMRSTPSPYANDPVAPAPPRAAP
ncbi:hypothetical protein SAMN05428957_1093 [Oryzisolibacter propanilivorax]|uniref:Entry exclusion lipoprotein TrbK n=1 Tax=Oryzisolibacter propanilivorax TaxID=1527607 RepID=A0A1G9UIM3_9BURK|nr:EexN family lipoprotein [Oryzisolibacter propanilivorax]SDM59747.1 hypothetical protein SAMN05428957_1093 [Oryzisolibacter propanilivorax]